MGRAFEFRKERKFKRWAKMAVQFTRLGKEIVMAVKAGGGDVNTNSRLRTAVQNSKAVNMPKDRVEAAIKRATNRDEKDYEELVYEGYAAHGVAVLVETATDNTNRTVANVRSYFTKYNGGRWVKQVRLILFLPAKPYLLLNPATATWKNWSLN
jgi:YebC/PmpR family DNA-binding regulatory protein